MIDHQIKLDAFHTLHLIGEDPLRCSILCKQSSPEISAAGGAWYVLTGSYRVGNRTVNICYRITMSLSKERDPVTQSFFLAEISRHLEQWIPGCLMPDIDLSTVDAYWVAISYCRIDPDVSTLDSDPDRTLTVTDQGIANYKRPFSRFRERWITMP